LHRSIYARSQGGYSVGGLPAQNVEGVGVDITIAIGHTFYLPKSVDRIGFLLAAAGVSCGFVGILRGSQEIVGIDVAATTGGNAVNVLCGLEGAAGQVGLVAQHVVGAVIGEFDRAVAGIGGRAIGVVVDGLGGAFEVVVGSLVNDATRVGYGLDP